MTVSSIYSCDECRELCFALMAAGTRASFARDRNDDVSWAFNRQMADEARVAYTHHIETVHVRADAALREDADGARGTPAPTSPVATSADPSGGARCREERVDRADSLTGCPAVPPPPETFAADAASPLRASAACPEPGAPPPAPGSGLSFAETGGSR